MKIKHESRWGYLEDLMMRLTIQQLRKGNMGTNVFMKFFLLIAYVSSGSSAYAQNSYCCNQLGKKIDFSVKRIDSLYIDYISCNNSVDFKIINPTKDTLYLFSSYFAKELLSSKYLHVLDKKHKKYYISYVPIVGNLTIKQSDKIILGEHRIGNKGQVLYDFIKLPPYTYYDFEVNYTDLFKNNKNAVKYFDSYSQSKFKEASFKSLTTNKLKGKYNLVFRFGIYNDVNFLCKESNYYLNEFDRRSKLFKIIEIPIKLNNPVYPLFE